MGKLHTRPPHALNPPFMSPCSGGKRQYIIYVNSQIGCVLVLGSINSCLCSGPMVQYLYIAVQSSIPTVVSCLFFNKMTFSCFVTFRFLRSLQIIADTIISSMKSIGAIVVLMVLFICILE